MFMENIYFQTVDWKQIDRIEHKGEKGSSFWQTIQLQGLRLRVVEYSKGYIADHWCKKGHIVHCLKGEFVTELEDGAVFTLNEGMTYMVSDNLSSHRSSTANGVQLMIIDGEFLKTEALE
jgi:hypothetical protein